MISNTRLFCRKLISTYTVLCYLPLLAVLVNLNACNSPASKTNTTNGDSISIKLPAPGTVSDAEKKRIAFDCERWFDTTLKNTGFNGGMLVSKNGVIVFEKYRGTDHLKGKDSITEHTPFHIASVSKTFTAMATLLLMQNGKVNIDSSYSYYFPEFNYPGITVRSLLSHRSGLPNYLVFMEKLGWDKKTFIKNTDVLNWLISKKEGIENIGAPNRRFSYCNTNFALLALLIEKVSGESYPAFMKKHFFTPLQMENSFVYSGGDSVKLPPNYDWKGGEIPLNFLDDVYGDKNIYSTPRDLLKWDRALAPNVIFKQETLDQAYSGYSNEKPGIKNYGLGWRMNIYPSGKKMIFHNGWWHGNNAVFIRLLDEDATIILVNNRFTSATYKARMLVNIFGTYFKADVDEESETTKVAEVTP